MRNNHSVTSKDGSIYYFKLEHHEKCRTASLYCSRFDYDQHLDKWSSATNANQLIIAQCGLEILDTKSSYSQNQDSDICCVVGCYSGSSVHLYYCSIRDCFIPNDEFNLGLEIHQHIKPITSPAINAWIVDGQRVLVLFNQLLFLSLEDSLTKKVSLNPLPLQQVSHLWSVTSYEYVYTSVVGLKDNPLINVKSTQHIPCDFRCITVFISQSLKAGNGETYEKLLNATIDPKGKIISTDCSIVPQCYRENIVSAAFYTPLAADTETVDITQTTDNEDQPKLLGLIIFTCAGQLLHFHHGRLERCAFISSKNALKQYQSSSKVSIHILHSYCGEDDVVVHFEEENIVYIISSQQFEVCFHAYPALTLMVLLFLYSYQQRQRC